MKKERYNAETRGFTSCARQSIRCEVLARAVSVATVKGRRLVWGGVDPDDDPELAGQSSSVLNVVAVQLY